MKPIYVTVFSLLSLWMFDPVRAANTRTPPFVVVQSFQDVLKVNRANPLFLAPAATDCVIGTLCKIDVTVDPLFDRSGKVVSCIARAIDINLKYGAGGHVGRDKIAIEWNLVDPGDKDASYSFDLVHGVLFLDDSLTAINVDDIKPRKVKVKHLLVKHLYKITYFPAVVQTPTTGTMSLCAAADPIMVND